MAPSIPWFAATQNIKCEQNLTGLAPKGCFLSAEAVESAVRQIGETQKAARELNGRDWRRFCGICGRLKFVSQTVSAGLRAAYWTGAKRI